MSVSVSVSVTWNSSYRRHVTPNRLPHRAVHSCILSVVNRRQSSADRRQYLATSTDMCFNNIPTMVAFYLTGKNSNLADRRQSEKRIFVSAKFFLRWDNFFLKSWFYGLSPQCTKFVSKFRGDTSRDD